MPDKVSPSQFAASVKEKYPQYKDVDDLKLTNAMIEKYPEYKDVVDFGIKATPAAPAVIAPAQPPVSKYQKAVNDDRSEIGKTLSTLYNNTIASLERFGGAIADIPAQFNVAAPGFAPTEIAKTQEQTKAFREQPLAKKLETVKELKQKIGKAADIARSGYTTREEEKAMVGQFNVMDGGIGLRDIQSLIASSGGMALDMGLGAVTGGTSFVLQGYNDAVEDYDASAAKAGIEPSAGARGLYGIAGGVINGLLEKFAVDKIVGDTPVFRDIQRKAIANVLKNTAGMTGKKAVDAIETAAVAEIKKLTNDWKRFGVRSAYRFGVEGGTESVQAALEDGAKFAANAVQGNEVFNEDEIKKGFLQNIVNSGIAGGVMGPVFGAGADKAFGRNVNTQVLKDIAEANTPEQLAAINDELAATFDENNFTQEERDAVMANANRYAQIKQTLPQGTSAIAQTIAIPLIEARIKLDNEIQNRKNNIQSVDEALKSDEEASISLLEDKRAQINDDIREVVNDEKFDYFEQDGKFYKKLGENAPEEISRNRFDLQQIKTGKYATPTSEGPVQEGGPEGDLGQRQGTQKAGAQAKVNEADTGYRYIVSEEGSEFPIAALVNKKVRKDGRPAILYQEGQRVVARILGTNRIEDVGNVVEMMDALPQDFGIEVDETVVTETPTGYRVEGEDMVNDNENPLDAISVDQNGKVMNVVLKTPSGKRRKFRGQAAQDLAYQITLKETLKNEDEFELFLEQEHQAELDAAEAKAAAEAETTAANEPVPTTQEPAPTEPTTTEPVAGPRVTTEPTYGRFTARSLFGPAAFLEGYNKLQRKVLKDAKNVLDAINFILKTQGKEASINLHDQKSFESAVIEAGGSKEDSTSRGFYMDSDGSIHLNMDNIASDTMLHEGFHPMLDFLESKNPAAINDLFAQLEKLPGAEGIIAQARATYTGDVTQKKEAITDFVAGVADGRVVLNPSNYAKIRKFILDMLNKIGIGKGGGSLVDVKNAQGLIKLAEFITEKFTKGDIILPTELLNLIKDRNEIATGEQGLVAAAGELTPERISDSKIGNVNPLQFSRPEKFKEVETVTLPSKSMMDVYNEFGGNAVAINSDPTRVGNLVLPSGKEIFMYGGLNYTALKPNVDGEIGFASTRISKPEQVSRIMNTLFSDRNGEGVVLVAAQKPDSMLGNAYALEYTLDAITQLPKKILRSAEFKDEFFGKDIAAIKEAFGEKEYSDFVKKYRGADLSNPDVMEDMIETLLTDIGNNFIARNSMVSNMLAGVVEKSTRSATKGQPGYVSVTPNKFIAKALYDRLGLNQEKLFYEIGEKGIVDEYMNKGNWGFVTTGFTSDGKIDPNTIQDKGVIHPQFNAKFHGKNPFILDGAYLIDKLFPPEDIIAKTGKPYTKKASLMVAGSMYPKGTIQKVVSPDTKGVPQFQKKAQIGVEKQSGTTQVATTTGSYTKAAKIAEKLGAKSVLDYGAGLGLGSDAIRSVIGDVESFEPNSERWQGSSPVTYTNTSDINKKYDSVINLNVLNVVPKDIRDAIVMDIFDKLNIGGNAIISTRKWSGDVNQAKNYVKGPEDKSVIIKRRSGGKEVDVYQKGFDGNELVDYINEILGDAATVTKDNSFGAAGVIINKKNDISEPQFQKAPTKPITKERGGIIKKGLKEQARYGILGKENIRLKELMSGELSAELATAETRVNEAMKTIKKYGGSVTEKDISDFMQGNSNGNQIPLDLAAQLSEMRAQIDGLTERLIQLGVVDSQESIDYYRDNMGKYMLRSYESINFKDTKTLSTLYGKGLNIDNVAKKLKNVDKTVVDAALTYLSDRAKAADPTLTDAEAMKIARADANEILSSSEDYIMNKGITGSTNVKSLRQRKDISPEIRALMGEYTDPLYNYYSTIFKISSLTSSRQYLNSLKEFGMGKFFFENKTEDATVKFAGDESDALAPLNGIWTFPEIKESLQIAQKETTSIYAQVAGRVRMFKTVYNPSTHVKNIIGNMGFAVSNGHWNKLPEAYKYIKGAIKGGSDKDVMQMMETLNRYGVLNNVIGVGELKSYFDNNESIDDFLKTIYNNANQNTTASKLGKAKANLSKIPKAIEKAYAIEDDVFKILAFVNESNRYAQAIYKKKYDKLSATEKKDIDGIASEIVKDTFPTFSRVPQGVKTLSKFAFLGNFLSFPVESVRTQYNSLALAKKEIMSGNSKLRDIGLTRISGAIVYNSIFSTLTVYAYNLAGAGLTGALGAAFGDDEKESTMWDSIKKYLAPWNKNSEVYVSKFKDGKLEYYDIGSLDSYGYQRRVWNAFWSTKNKGEFDKMMASAIGEALDPWMAVDMVYSNLMAIARNDDGLGGKVYNPEAKPLDRSKEIATFVGKQFGPGALGSAIKIADAYQKGETDKVMDEFGAQVFARHYTVDLNKQFQNYIYTEGTKKDKEVGFKDRLSDARNIYLDAKRQKLDPVDLSRKYQEALEQYKEILLTANGYYKAALMGGTNPKVLIQSLVKSRVGRAEAIAIVTGAFSKYDQAYIPK